MSEKLRQLRSVATKFETREEIREETTDEMHEERVKVKIPHISGYFASFSDVYEIAPGLTESIAPGAFSRTLGGDIRALVNHDTTLVLGRTKAHTLELKEDEHGLWGDITINPNDVDAMNLYERVKRGDVDQCSFGFEIVSEETEVRPDGSVHWTLKDVDLFEVSACTFPAYKDTNISARCAERDEIKARELEAWKNKMKEAVKHGSQDPADA